jgi:murein DD-endopeptidase MepM/ murein hydrolase activator NlpD
MPHKHQKLRGSCALALCLLSSSNSALAETTDAHGGIAADLETAQLLAEISTQSAQETVLATERTQLAGQQEALHAALRSRIHALYRLTRNGMTPVTGGFDALRAHVGRVRRLRALVENDVQAWSQAEARSRTVRSEAEITHAALARAREQLAAREAAASSAVAAERAALANPVSPTAAPGPERNFYGLRVSAEPAQAHAGFGLLRGKLPWPVTAEARVADQSEALGPGLVFEVKAHSAVRAVAAGRVLITTESPTHGRRVVIDHGDGYLSTYAHLGSVDVRTGDELSTHARIGDVGSEIQPAGLLFELKHGSRSLRPRPWFGL